jgi:polyisoprenoid-binding protein YceI
MNANELKELLDSGKSCLLLNVLPEEIHAARRIPGSSNACVYEVAFLDQVAGLAESKEAAIVVYGAGEGSFDSKAAVTKLKAAGYADVVDFPGGLAGWQAAGFTVESHGQLPEASRLDGRFAISTAESLIRWTGRNLFNHHNGTVRLASGEIHVIDGVLESARFVIDMKSIACEDLVDAQWNAMLIRHLHDADFFEVGRFPTAEFVADRADAISGSTEGTPNYLLKGNFTLRGVTRPLEFPVVIASADGKRITGQGQFELDRTEFGSIYGSGKFFRFLGKHVVNDHIHLHVKVHADLLSES